MKRSLEFDNIAPPTLSLSPPPPNGFAWNELLPEMQGEVVERLDSGTCECLALTSKFGYGKYHRKEFDSLEGQINVLARDAPTNYLVNYLTGLNRMPGGYQRGRVDDRYLLVKFFYLNVVKTHRLPDAYNGHSLFSEIRQQFGWLNWNGPNSWYKHFLLEYGNVMDFITAKSVLGSHVCSPTDDDSWLDLMLTAGNVTLILYVYDLPFRWQYHPYVQSSEDAIEESVMRRIASACFSGYECVDWHKLFSHAGWKSWLKSQNDSINTCDYYARTLFEVLDKFERPYYEPYYELNAHLIINAVAIIEFVNIAPAEKRRLIDRLYWIIFKRSHVALIEVVDKIGFTRPAVPIFEVHNSSNILLENSYFLRRIAQRPYNPMLHWLAENNYLTSLAHAYTNLSPAEETNPIIKLATYDRSIKPWFDMYVFKRGTPPPPPPPSLGQ